MNPWLISILAFLCICCSKSGKLDPLLKQGKLVFEDNFNRKELGNDWYDTGGKYRIENGQLRAQNGKNRPLWLKKKLPRNARVSFDARSESPDIDIKVELFGDGKSKAIKASYTATSYVVILGGWKNRRSIIARMDEHKDDREARDAPKGIQGKTYHFNIIRKDSRLAWYLDGKHFLEMDDKAPLEGPGHENFAFNNWSSNVFFDDLAIFEL